jgi:hypothetical protein
MSSRTLRTSARIVDSVRARYAAEKPSIRSLGRALCIHHNTVKRILSGDYLRVPTGRRRTRWVHVRVTGTEKTELKKLAAGEGLTVQAYVHRAVFGVD